MRQRINKTSKLNNQVNLNVIGVYDLDHIKQAIIKPDKVFRLSYYFIDYWLPLLKPNYAWLVVALQQTHWQTVSQRGQITQNRLGELSGLKRRRIIQLFNQVKETHQIAPPILAQKTQAASLLTWFIRHIEHTVDAEGGGQAANKYHVLLNAPLTPPMAAELQRILAKSESITDTIQKLLAQDRPTLLKKLQKNGHKLPWSTQPITIHQIILNKAWPHPKDELQKLAQTLSNHLLQPNEFYLGTQYFRQNWVPVLGPTLAWFISIIRRHSYQNAQTGETRNRFNYHQEDMAARLGVATRTLKRNLDNTTLQQLTPFFTELQIHRGQITGQIHVKAEPLTTPDSSQCQDLLASTQTKLDLLVNEQTIEAIGQNYTPKTDKITHREQTKLHTENGQNYTPRTDKTAHREQTKLHTENRQNCTPLPTNDGQNCTPFKTLIDTTILTPSLKDSKSVDDDFNINSKPTSTKTLSNNEVLQQLQYLNIREPKRSYLARLAWINAPNYLSDWVYWFKQQSKFDSGWVILQLEAGDWPPVPEIDLDNFNLPLDDNTIDSLESIPVYQQIWQQALQILKTQMTQATFNAWLKPTQALSNNQNTLVVQVKNSYAKEWLDARLKTTIERVLQNTTGEADYRVDFRIA